jgi:dienelactone hydrolase
VPSAGGPVERVLAGQRDVSRFDIGRKGELIVLESQPQYPAEVSVLVPGGLRRVTSVNDAFLKGIKLADVERFKAASRDGTLVDGFLTRPAGAAGRSPALLRIHGGPVSQFSTRFSFEWQLFAAHGYAVIAANPRGSSGYGRDFSYAIWADWGNRDGDDVLAAVDHAVGAGAADPDRLGVGGWSYGGILTNYVIARTTRFKAATSGAGISNVLAGYGTDHYQREYEAELGLPWEDVQPWLKISGPFLRADRIKTPTLFLCGQDDMNVPLLNSEQMYQALRRLGVPTELVIYPGQNHGIVKPSFQKDRYERYLAWYDQHLKGRPALVANKGPQPEATSLLGKPLSAPALTAEARKPLDENLQKATAEFVRNPDDADTIIWVGRRLAYLSRFREAVDVYTRGIQKHPDDVRLYRHRGHRYVTLRELDKAIADFETADRLIREKNVPDAIEPDGIPSRRGQPTSTTRFNVYYHKGLAHYLKGDFEKALAAYRECMKYSTASPENLVATSDWLYMTLRRLGRSAEAAKVLDPIHPALDVVDNTAYFNRLLLYKGQKKAEDVLDPATEDPVQLATQGYGVGNWYLYGGQPQKAREIFDKVVAGSGWAAFGYIAAEAELARMR